MKTRELPGCPWWCTDHMASAADSSDWFVQHRHQMKDVAAVKVDGYFEDTISLEAVLCIDTGTPEHRVSLHGTHDLTADDARRLAAKLIEAAAMIEEPTTGRAR